MKLLTMTRKMGPAQRAPNRRQQLVCFRVSRDDEVICKQHWGSV